MKYYMAILSLLLFSACSAPYSHNPDRVVQNGSPCPQQGLFARDTDGDITVCAENGE